MREKKTLRRGANLKPALAEVRRVGGEYWSIKGTGDIAVRLPGHHRTLRVSGHRKDAPRHLTRSLAKIRRAGGRS